MSYLIQDMIAAGVTDEQIIDYMTKRGWDRGEAYDRLDFLRDG